MEKSEWCETARRENALIFSGDWNRVTDLAQKIELEYKPTIDELLTTVINRDEVEELVKRPVETRLALIVARFYTFLGPPLFQ